MRELATMCREEYPKAAPLIASNMFVDDFVAGVEDGSGAIRFITSLVT